MPRGAARSRPWITKRLELQSIDRESGRDPVLDQSLTICRNQVTHPTTEPEVTMQPQSAIHRVNHSLPARAELTHVDLRLAARH